MLHPFTVFISTLLVGFDPDWILFVVAVLVVIGVVQGRRRRAVPSDGDENDGPLLVFPSPAAAVEASIPTRIRTLEPATGIAPDWTVPPAATTPAEPVGDGPEPEIEPDSTLQLLPGRLEILNGPDAGRLIPFIRLPGQAVPEVTIGRAEGPLYRHIRIEDQTVSRFHARLRLDSRHWTILNLSETNPLTVNGRALPSPEEAVVLVSGDRIQFGAVELRYREGSA